MPWLNPSGSMFLDSTSRLQFMSCLDEYTKSRIFVVFASSICLLGPMSLVR